MATKKFKNEEDYNVALSKVEYKSIMYTNILEAFIERKMLVEKPTDYLHQAHMLIEIANEKINQHNAECKRLATVMKTKAYKRNNIQNFNW